MAYYCAFIVEKRFHISLLSINRITVFGFSSQSSSNPSSLFGGEILLQICRLISLIYKTKAHFQGVSISPLKECYSLN